MTSTSYVRFFLYQLHRQQCMSREFEINIYIDDAENRIGLEYYSS